MKNIKNSVGNSEKYRSKTPSLRLKRLRIHPIASIYKNQHSNIVYGKNPFCHSNKKLEVKGAKTARNSTNSLIINKVKKELKHIDKIISNSSEKLSRSQSKYHSRSNLEDE